MAEQFTWTTESGETLTMPPAGRIRTRLLRQVRGLTDNLDVMFTLLDGVLDEHGRGVVDEMPVDELNRMFAAWQATLHGATLGESSGSSSS